MKMKWQIGQPRPFSFCFFVCSAFVFDGCCASAGAACGLIAFSLTSEEMEDLEKQFEE